jgi:hypothetical protein
LPGAQPPAPQPPAAALALGAAGTSTAFTAESELHATSAEPEPMTVSAAAMVLKFSMVRRPRKGARRMPRVRSGSAFGRRRSQARARTILDDAKAASPATTTRH